MPATLPIPTDAPALAVFSDRRSDYERVAVCPSRVEVDNWPRRSHQMERERFVTSQKSVTDDGSVPEPACDYLMISRMMRFARQARFDALRELSIRQQHYEGITAPHVAQTAFLVAAALGVLQPNSVVTTLTYDQSLHARAELPFGYGSVHVSVLFTPGLNPLQHAGEREEADNTLISVFDGKGMLNNSTEGPLVLALKQLTALTARLPLLAAKAV